MIRSAALSIFALASPIVSAETVSLTTGLSGSYSTNGGVSTPVTIADFPAISRVTDTAGTHYVEADGVNIVDNTGGFFFQNGGVATGYSAGGSSSILDVTITNNTRASADLQLDSQITPGHLAARYVGGAAGSAGYAFSIGEITGRNFFPALYTSNATLNLQTLALSSQSATFNTLNGLRVTHSKNAVAYDWSATNIAVDLGTFAAGQTRVFEYALDTSFLIGPGARGTFNAPVPVCNGVQASFGDPRTRGGNGGGAANVARPFGERGPSGPNAANCDAGRVNPFIGLPFGPYSGGALVSVVPGGSPLPAQPTPDGPINYSVPEPSALALFGLGALSLMRTRRRSV